MKKYCRYCANMVYGDSCYCEVKQKCLKYNSVKRPNKCKDFELNPVDALGENPKEYKPRKEKTLDQLLIVAKEEANVVEIPDAPRWISTAEQLPKFEVEVLLFCETRPSRYKYVCIGYYVPEGIYKEQSSYSWDYEALGEYDEEKDDYLIPCGWYECMHNWDDYACIGIADFVTHWMPLPKPPEMNHE